MDFEGRRIEIRGTVQGVGFRPWVYRLAQEQRIAGRVRNDATGVTIEAFGAAAALDAFVDCLQASPPPAAAIVGVHWHPIVPEAVSDFRIVSSRGGEELRVSIPPDLATCPDCVAEIFDAADRRFRYPFTNCTNCGPRFSIAHDVPYDRPATTMARFLMCPACQGEYSAVLDRRFHAQPNACPTCGPQLRVLSAAGSLIAADPIHVAAEALRTGAIVALKGIGGFHLACDATDGAAVQRLRQRKRRDQKPFAVMVRDLSAAEAVAVLNSLERRLLASVERPIVLAKRRPGTGLAEAVAPHNPLLGLMLPYTPLHHLLLAAAGRPLVMTSGNVAEEPIAHRNDEALERLRGIADLFVVHDREIVTRCDDSVVRVIAGAPMVLRRSRGYVPRAVHVAPGFARPVLACGAHLKNTFCFGVGDTAYFGPHIGDLETLATFESFKESIERMQRFLRVRPEVIAHDLHPEYLSTVYAGGRPEAVKIAVQHHHAHVASAMGEHGLAGPVIGVAFDGTGYGTDGTSWGGEFLVADYAGFERVATFRPIPLPGGDTAIRQVWRVALALLDDAFDGNPPLDALPLFHDIAADQLRVIRQMIARRIQSPPAHGVGRYFDALGAIVLARPRAGYEGQVAMEWNFVADARETGAYPYVVNQRSTPWTIDLRALVRDAVGDSFHSRPASTISAKFHNTIADATAAVVRLIARRVGNLPVVLTGGCFQNALLTEAVLARLSSNLSVYRHRDVPPGDGGLALGQALVAGAIFSRRS